MIDNNQSNVGLLLTPDIKLHRQWFVEMCKLNGIYVVYRACKPDKTWTTYTEIESNYEDPERVGCIFDEHPTQRTLKKMGWVSELQENSSIIHVPYDLRNLQVGSLFIVPSGIDGAQGRLFRVVSLMNGIIYPASMACEIVPEYKDTFNKAVYDTKHSSLSLLNAEEDNM